MGALIQVAKAYQRDGKNYHPCTGDEIQTSVNGEIFLLWADNSDTGQPMVSFVLSRPVLESISYAMEKTLTVEPVKVRRA